MELRDWVALTGIVATATVAIVTLLFNRHRETVQQERDDRLRKEQQAREDAMREKERSDEPQAEFNIDCNFYGPHHGSYVVELLLTAHNKGRVKQDFEHVRLRIRGIEENQSLTFWEGREPRLNFPEELVNAAVGSFFAEPGEKHILTYVTKIPASVKFVSAYAKYSYGANSLQDTERVFPVRVK